MWVSKEEKSCLRKPWRRTLIIRLLGRSIGYNFLLRKLKTIWTPTASFELITLDNGFFLVRFSSLDDNNHAKFGVSRLIFIITLLLVHGNQILTLFKILSVVYYCGFVFLACPLNIMILTF